MFVSHEKLYDFGTSKQSLLSRKKVLLIGCGGLGCSCALHLSMSGLNFIRIVDADKISLSNLHRQIAFQESDIGRYKSDVLAEQCLIKNKNLQVDIHNIFCDENNIEHLLNDIDVVVDCTDSASVKSLLNITCRKKQIPLVFGSAIGWDGICFTILPTGPCLECVFPDYRLTSDSCDGLGVLGPVPNLIGTIQAVETIKLCTNVSINTKLLMYSAYDGEFTHVDCEFDPVCKICNPNISKQEEIYDVKFSSIDLYNKDILILDIRKEYDEEHSVFNSKWKPSIDIDEIISLSTQYKFVYILCEKGERSLNLCHKIKLSNVLSIVGGIREIFKE